MDEIQRNNLVKLLLNGTYLIELREGKRHARNIFRRKASHYRVEGEKLYKVSQILMNTCIFNVYAIRLYVDNLLHKLKTFRAEICINGPPRTTLSLVRIIL